MAAALRGFLEGEVELKFAQQLEEALVIVKAKAPDIVLSSVGPLFNGELLASQVHQISKGTLVVLVYQPDEPNPHHRASRAMADAFVVGPLRKPAILSALHSVLSIRNLKQHVQKLQREVDRLQKAKANEGKAALNAPDVGFFKKYMLLEVRRSKRYRYPVSLLVVGFDAWKTGDETPAVDATAMRAQCIDALSRCTREVDMVIPFAHERFLVLLPHTARNGASEVAERIRSALSELSAVATTASVGVATFDPKATAQDTASFGSLARQAESAQAKASAEGGDRVAFADAATPIKRSRISMG